MTSAVAAEAVAEAVDHREGLARALGVAQVAEREMALGGEPADLARAGREDAGAVGGEHDGVVAQVVGGGVFRGRVPAHRLEARLRGPEALDEEGPGREERRQRALDARREHRGRAGDGTDGRRVVPALAERGEQWLRERIAADRELVDALAHDRPPRAVPVEPPHLAGEADPPP